MKFELKTEACPEASRVLVRACMAFVRIFIHHADFYELELCLAEAVNNVVKHAYRRKDGELEIRVAAVSPEYIQFEVSDWGKPFVLPSKNPSHEDTSGRGIYIMNRIADEFDYVRIAEKNTVRMRKYIKEEEWKI
ncbi:MAG: ATP-binding protein [Thermodesulfobacteriota bacterium]